MIATADGYDPTKMENAMRALSTKVLNQGEVSRKKIYPINYVDEDAEEINQLHDDEPDEGSVMAALLEEGDESAMVIQEFERRTSFRCAKTPPSWRWPFRLTRMLELDFVTKQGTVGSGL